MLRFLRKNPFSLKFSSIFFFKITHLIYPRNVLKEGLNGSKPNNNPFSGYASIFSSNQSMIHLLNETFKLKNLKYVKKLLKTIKTISLQKKFKHPSLISRLYSGISHTRKKTFAYSHFIRKLEAIKVGINKLCGKVSDNGRRHEK